MTEYLHPNKKSTAAHLTQLGLRLIQRRKRMIREVQTGQFPHDAAAIPGSVLKTCEVQESQFLGRKLWVIAPKGQPVKKGMSSDVLYLHGGAYTRNIISYQWDMIGRLVQLSGASFLVPDYPLAPNAGWQEVQRYVHQLWDEYCVEKPPILLGDSAGGGLALALTQQLMAAQKPQPAQTILLSPWLNLAGDDALVKKIAPSDPMLEPQGTLAAAQCYAQGSDLKTPDISPLYGPISGLEKLSVFAGGNDILYPDALALRSACQQQGVSINFYDYPTMLHVWMAVSWLPEARSAQRQIANLIKK